MKRIKDDCMETLPRTTDAKSWFDSGWNAHKWQCRWDTVYAALYGLLCGVGVAGILRIWLEL